MTHDQHSVAFDQGFWDERYRSRGALWSGRPNPHLVTEASDLRPGTVLDAGSGEGADAVWLASRGWTVTAVDVSEVAIERAARHAEDAGVAARIDWQHRDLTEWVPPEGAFDLVSAQYLHMPWLFGGLAAAVAPGGTLLVVGHDVSDLDTAAQRPNVPDLYFTGDDVVALLDPGGWDVVTNAAPSRHAVDPDGNELTVRDTVLRARRHG